MEQDLSLIHICTLAEQRRAKAKEEEFRANAKVNLDDLFAQIKEGVQELNIIVKADVGGSAEAVKQSLEKISNDEVRVRVIHSAVGEHYVALGYAADCGVDNAHAHFVVGDLFKRLLD